MSAGSARRRAGGGRFGRAAGTVAALLTTAAAHAAPDVAVTELYTSEEAPAGGSVGVAVRLRNGGVDPSPEGTLTLRLSTDALPSAGDTTLCTRPVPALAGGGGEALLDVAGCALPTPPTGPWFLVVTVAVAGDANASNDSAGAALTLQLSPSPLPDLRLTGLTSRSPTAPGSTAWFRYVARNAGGGAGGAHANWVRVSPDAAYDFFDPLMCQHAVSAFPPAGHAAWRVASACAMPASATLGAGFIALNGDGNPDVTEANESNNRASGPVTLATGALDLRAVSLAVPPTLAPGSPFVPAVAVSVDGAQGVGAYDIALTLRPAAGGAATTLCTAALEPLGGGASTTARLPGCEVPASLAAGAYVLTATVDAGAAYAESDETDNAATAPLTVGSATLGPDLVVASVTPPVTAVPGVAFDVSVVVRNDGDAASGSATVAVREGASFAGGTQRCSSRVGALGPGGSSTVTVRGCALSGAPGSRTLWARVDAADVVAESDEGNNDGSGSVTVVSAPADVDLLPVDALATAVGREVEVSYRLRNDGGDDAPATTTALSLLATPTAVSGTPLCTDAASAVPAGVGRARTVRGCRVPSDWPAGPAYVAVVVDADGVIPEADEGNNRAVAAVVIEPLDTGDDPGVLPDTDGPADTDPPAETDGLDTAGGGSAPLPPLGCQCGVTPRPAAPGGVLWTLLSLGGVLRARRRRAGTPGGL